MQSIDTVSHQRDPNTLMRKDLMTMLFSIEDPRLIRHIQQMPLATIVLRVALIIIDKEGTTSKESQRNHQVWNIKVLAIAMARNINLLVHRDGRKRVIRSNGFNCLTEHSRCLRVGASRCLHANDPMRVGPKAEGFCIIQRYAPG